MNYQAAAAWVAAMNVTNYLGHSDWHLPTTPLDDKNCGRTGPTGNKFGFGCSQGALASPYNRERRPSPATASRLVPTSRQSTTLRRNGATTQTGTFLTVHQ